MPKPEEPKQPSGARYKVVLDLGPDPLGEPIPANVERVEREAHALARAARKLWNTRAARVLQRAAEVAAHQERERRI